MANYPREGRDAAEAARTYFKASGDGTDGDPFVPIIDTTGAGSAATPTISRVAGATGDTEILAASGDRKGATLYNDSAAVLTLALDDAVSATSFTLKIASGGYYELPFGYTGAIHGLWASATGYVYVTELA